MNDSDLKKEQEAQLAEANTLLSIDSAIKEHIEKINTLKEEITPQKEMLSSFLENNEKYREATDLSKKASQNKSFIKKQLLDSPGGKPLVLKLDELKEQMRELEEGLSYYLREYQRITGSNEFEDAKGELHEIKFVAKLVRKTDLNR